MKKALLPLLLPLMLLIALPAQAAEQFKDYMFTGLPNYEIYSQVKNFNQLTVKSQKSQDEEFVETTYEGNLSYTTYQYKGAAEVVPSDLQIRRNYENAVKKLEGAITYNRETELHTSFKRNDKQYYMTVSVHDGCSRIEVKILEVAEMQEDIDVLPKP